MKLANKQSQNQVITYTTAIRHLFCIYTKQGGLLLSKPKKKL